MPGLLRQPPAVLPLYWRQQPQHELPGVRRGSTRANRPATRNISSSNSSRQLAGSTLWPAATAPSSGVHTTPHDHAVAAPFTPVTSKITN
jgi:hypothetical protein